VKHRWFSLIPSALALAAALFCAVLPGGFLPKVAGRCGRQLCNCPIEPLDTCQKCSLAAHTCAPVHLLTFETSISGAEAPGMALQIVFTGLLAPQRLQLALVSTERDLPNAARALFALSEVSPDIATPPPRA